VAAVLRNREQESDYYIALRCAIQTPAHRTIQRPIGCDLVFRSAVRWAQPLILLENADFGTCDLFELRATLVYACAEPQSNVLGGSQFGAPGGVGLILHRNPIQKSFSGPAHGSGRADPTSLTAPSP
jgi:hypothetical protein